MWHKNLHSVSDAMLLTRHQLEKSLADWLASLLSDIISNILNVFNGYPTRLIKLVYCSLVDGCVPACFKLSIVTGLSLVPLSGIKSYHSAGLRFISKLVECGLAIRRW